MNKLLTLTEITEDLNNGINSVAHKYQIETNCTDEQKDEFKKEILNGVFNVWGSLFDSPMRMG